MPKKKHRKKKQKQQQKLQISAQTKADTFALETAKRLYKEAMKNFGQGPLHETLAKLNIASEIYPRLIDFTVIPRVITTDGNYLGRFEQFDTQENSKIINLLKGKDGYIKRIHDQSSQNATDDKNLSDLLNDIYLYSCMLNLDKLENAPNPSQLLGNIDQIRKRLNKIAKRSSVSEAFIYFQLSRVEKLAGNYSSEISHLKQSARLGNPFSASRLGYYQLAGYKKTNGQILVKQDTKLAVKELRKSIDMGASQSAFLLGTTYLETGEEDIAKEYFEEASTDNHPLAIKALLRLRREKYVKSLKPPTLPIPTKRQNTDQLKIQIESLLTLMPEYYKNNSDEKIKNQLSEISQKPGLCLLANALTQLLYSGFFHDNRYRMRSTTTKYGFDVKLPVWNVWMKIASQNIVYTPLFELIEATHALTLHLAIIHSIEKLNLIADVSHCMGRLVEELYKNPAHPKDNIRRTLRTIVSGTFTQEDAIFLKPAIQDPTLFTVSTACNYVSTIQEASKLQCAQQYAQLTLYINSKSENRNPIFHYTAYKHFSSNPTATPIPEAKLTLGRKHLLKAKQGGLTIAGIMHEDLAEVGTKKDYKASKATLEKYHEISLHSESKLPHPKALLQLGRLEQTYGHYAAAKQYYEKARENGNIESHQYLAKLQLEQFQHELRTGYDEERLSLTSKAIEAEKAAKEAILKKQEAAKIKQEKQEAQLTIKAEAAKQRAAIKAQLKLERKAEREKEQREKEAAEKASAKQLIIEKEQQAKAAIEKEKQRTIQAEKREAKKEKQRQARQVKLAEKREKQRAEKEKRKAQKAHLKKLKEKKSAKKQEPNKNSEKASIESEKPLPNRTPKTQKEPLKKREAKQKKTKGKKSLMLPRLITQTDSKKSRHSFFSPKPSQYNLFDACYAPNDPLTVLKVLHTKIQAGSLECRIFYDILSKITSSVESLHRLQVGLFNLQHNIAITSPLLSEELAWLGLTLCLGTRIYKPQIGAHFLELAHSGQPSPPLLAAIAIVNRHANADPALVRAQFYEAARPELFGDDEHGYQTVYRYKPAEILGSQIRIQAYQPHFFQGHISETNSSTDESNTLSSPSPVTSPSDSSRSTSPNNLPSHKRQG